MTKNVLQYIEENRSLLLDELMEFLAIPSVSTDSSYKEDVKHAARFVEEYLNEIGFSNVTQMDTSGHPLVYG